MCSGSSRRPSSIDRHAVRAFEIGDERRIGLDHVVFARPQAKHADVGVAADLDAHVKRRRLAPVVVVLRELKVLAPVPDREHVRAGPDHVRCHELADLARGDAAVGLDRILADHGRHHGGHGTEEEARAHLLQLHLEGVVVDDGGLGHHVGKDARVAIGKVHGDDAVPRILHVMRRSGRSRRGT